MTRHQDLDFKAIAERVRAHRTGLGKDAQEIAEQLGVSRAALYRIEKGEIVKIETLQKLAKILNTSLASLLGVGVEYFGSAISFMERMRQLEEGAIRILSHFEPLSYLLTSDEYPRYLALMLKESGHADDQVKLMLRLLEERRQFFRSHPKPIVNLVGIRALERFVHFGLIGRLDLEPAVRMERSLAARREVEHLIRLLDEQPMGIQIGLIEESLPSTTFQVFEARGQSHVVVSPFRLGEFPNVGVGIATVSGSAEAVRLYTAMVDQLWARSLRGASAARALRAMLRRV